VAAASDSLTGWATVALAAVAVVTLVYGVITTRLDRKDADRRIEEQQDHDDQRAKRDREDADRRIGEQRDYDEQRAKRDRADAEARLAAERTAADQRLADERAHAESTRRRERQQDSAARLLARIADLLPQMGRVPNVFRAAFAAQGHMHVDAEPYIVCERAVEALRFGGVADLPGLSDTRSTEQYRTLVHLVLTVARNEHQQDEEADKTARQDRGRLVALDLWRYGTFVRLSLEHLIEHGESLDPGQGDAGVSFPMLRRQSGDGALWFPPNVPQGWQEAISRDPIDPQYRPAK
jgi:hypothetical protein